MFALLNIVNRNQTVKNILVVASGTAGAQLIAMASTPFVTRLYGPDALGILGSFLAILAILTPLGSFSFPIAIVLPKDNKIAVKLAHLSFKIAICVCILLTLIIVFFKHPILTLSQLTVLSDYLIFLPLALLLTVLTAISNQWIIRHKLFKLNAKIIIFTAFFTSAIKIFLGFYFPYGQTLIGITLLILFLNLLIIHVILRCLGSEEMRVPIGISHDFSLIKKYQQFALYRTPQSIIASMNQNIPVVLIASYFGMAGAGFYALTRTVLFVPVNLIAKSVGDVLYPKLNDKSINQESITPIIQKSTLALIAIGSFPLGIMLLYGPELFAFVFGEKWLKAGEYAKWLSILFFFNFINRPSVAAIPILKLERLLLLNSILNSCLSISAFLLAAHFFSDDVIVIAAYSLVGIIPQMLLILFVVFIAKKHDKSLVLINERY